MAYSELVSFIREQLGAGRDARTIREHLIRRNINNESIDAAFDEVFKIKPDSNHKSSLEAFIGIGVVVLVLVFVGIGLSLYSKITPEVEVLPKHVESSETPFEPVTMSNEESEKTILCDFDDSESKYQCYLLKFENNEVYCSEIEDIDERDFCYVAEDLYALNV